MSDVRWPYEIVDDAVVAGRGYLYLFESNRIKSRGWGFLGDGFVGWLVCGGVGYGGIGYEGGWGEGEGCRRWDSVFGGGYGHFVRNFTCDLGC